MPRKAKALARQLSGLLVLLGFLGSCTPPGDISAGLPTTDGNSGVYLIDTLTVHLATVLRDSVNTSTSAYLLAGRYHDPRLGTVSATSYFRLGLSASYVPSATEVFDSLTLVLKTDALRYGDTTRLQSVEVHRLRDQLIDEKTYYTFDALAYDNAALNQGAGANRPFRARLSLRTVRLRLADALGRELLAAGRAGALSTAAQLNARLAGLALVPGPADDAALVRFLLTDPASGLNLYTHNADDPTVALARQFPLRASGKHFYQVAADRSGTLLAPLVTRLQALDASRTAQEAYLDGLLGLQLKLEIPYLAALRDFGSHLTVSSAQVSFEEVPGAATRYLTPPASLTAFLATRGNRAGLRLSNSAIGYQAGQSVHTGLDTGGYGLNLREYCQAVIDRAIPNDGLLLSSAVSESPERVVLGGPHHREVPLKLKLYLVQ